MTTSKQANKLVYKEREQDPCLPNFPLLLKA